jgi:hypothetical protein
MSDEPFTPDGELSQKVEVAVQLPAPALPEMVIPKRMTRKKFVRTITLKEIENDGVMREVQIPATLRDARLQQVILITKVQKTQERALDAILDDPNRILSPGEMQGLNTAVKTSGDMMIKAFGGDQSVSASDEVRGAATIGTALGVGISAGLSMIASADPDLANALIAVTKSAKKVKKTEPINVTGT